MMKLFQALTTQVRITSADQEPLPLAPPDEFMTAATDMLPGPQDAPAPLPPSEPAETVPEPSF